MRTGHLCAAAGNKRLDAGTLACASAGLFVGRGRERERFARTFGADTILDQLPLGGGCGGFANAGCGAGGGGAAAACALELAGSGCCLGGGGSGSVGGGGSGSAAACALQPAAFVGVNGTCAAACGLELVSQGFFGVDGTCAAACDLELAGLVEVRPQERRHGGFGLPCASSSADLGGGAAFAAASKMTLGLRGFEGMLS